ncbi:MAG: response regulator [Chitinophagaceae bacterium]
MIQILVVDDEKDVQSLFTQRFRKEIRENKVAFVFAFAAEDALNYLNQHQDEKCYVLSDINMPGISGFELLQRIKQNKYETPPIVMMVTAYGDTDNYHHALELGADDFLTKPLDFNVLKEKLKILA